MRFTRAWRKLRSIDVDLIAQHDLDRVRKRALDRWFLAPPGRRCSPRLVILVRRRKPHADNLSRSGSFGHDRHQLGCAICGRSSTDTPIGLRKDGKRHRRRRCCRSRAAGFEAAVRSDCRSRRPASCPGSGRTDHTNRKPISGQRSIVAVIRSAPRRRASAAGTGSVKNIHA